MVPQGLIADPEVAERARRAAELQARIASKFESLVKDIEPSPPIEDPIRYLYIFSFIHNAEKSASR